MTVLFDSNVLIAYFDKSHQHNEPSRAVIAALDYGDILVSAHSMSEVFNKLTRGGTTNPLAPDVIALVVGDFAARVIVRALTADQTLLAITEFARLGGRGPRVYDYLIGKVAVHHDASTIVTWNVRDMAPLFPTLTVITPADFTGVA